MTQGRHQPLEERFWAKVAKGRAGECWEWLASKTIAGYGQIGQHRSMPGPRNLMAHRVAYELLVGPIPEGMVIDHLCRNRGCVNPRHMEVVTHGENLRRGMGFSGLNARKTHCVAGHPLEGEHLYVDPKGRRQCRTCRREAMRRAARARILAVVDGFEHGQVAELRARKAADG